jgi:DNA-binding transcriptional ArsR family regulator
MSKGARSSRNHELDQVCRAIAEPTRRAILDLLAHAPRTTNDIAGRFPTTRFATMKHLAVLQKAGLLVVTRRGRERWNHINVVPLVRLHERWVTPLAERSAGALLALKRHLEREN